MGGVFAAIFDACSCCGGGMQVDAEVQMCDNWHHLGFATGTD